MSIEQVAEHIRTLIQEYETRMWNMSCTVEALAAGGEVWDEFAKQMPFDVMGAFEEDGLTVGEGMNSLIGAVQACHNTVNELRFLLVLAEGVLAGDGE